MLNLVSKTPPAWAERAVANVDEVLVDHAHCEKKAAGAAIRTLFRYPQHDFLQRPLARLAREELEHFERVLGILAARGVAFGRQKPSPYGGRLHACARQGEPAQLIDALLVAALIEARSCERFQILAARLAEPELVELYCELLASEARHHQLYVELASQLEERERVRARLAELAEREAEIVAEGSPLVRLHG